MDIENGIGMKRQLPQNSFLVVIASGFFLGSILEGYFFSTRFEWMVTYVADGAFFVMLGFIFSLLPRAKPKLTRSWASRHASEIEEYKTKLGSQGLQEMGNGIAMIVLIFIGILGVFTLAYIPFASWSSWLNCSNFLGLFAGWSFGSLLRAR